MKLYKYKEFFAPTGDDYERLRSILEGCAFWCAQPAALNDPQEFVWFCDFEHSEATVSLLSALLVKFNGTAEAVARAQAMAAVTQRRLEALARPVFESIVSNCRNELGVVSFGVDSNNPCLWQRYGGVGAGVCVELEVPAELLGTALHKVCYLPTKSMPVDEILHAFLNLPNSRAIYSLALLSKPLAWTPEAEVRFVSKMHSVEVRMQDSHISGIVLGNNLSASVRAELEKLLASLSRPLPILPN